MKTTAFSLALGVHPRRISIVRTSTSFVTSRRARSFCRVRSTPISQLTNDNSENSDEVGDKNAAFDNDLLPEAARRRLGKDPQELLQRLKTTASEMDNASSLMETKEAAAVASAVTGLGFLLTALPRILLSNVEGYLSSSPRILVASSIAILFGFFASTSATTIIGSVADWDPLAAFVLLVWTESFTRIYYRTNVRERSRILQLVNAFKIGLIYGMAVDAFKLST